MEEPDNNTQQNQNNDSNQNNQENNTNFAQDHHRNNDHYEQNFSPPIPTEPSDNQQNQQSSFTPQQPDELKSDQPPTDQAKPEEQQAQNQQSYNQPQFNNPPQAPANTQTSNRASELINSIKQAYSEHIVGQNEMFESIIVSLLSGGHFVN